MMLIMDPEATRYEVMGTKCWPVVAVFKFGCSTQTKSTTIRRKQSIAFGIAASAIGYWVPY